ncbi:MAG: transcription antitermination factor NusB [Gemmatimonadota bacterium]
MKPSHPRTRARSWVLQLLYGWDLSDEESPAAYARRVMARRRPGHRYRPHIEELLSWIDQHLGEIDARLEAQMANWHLDRLAVIDRNVLRIGTAELLCSDSVPPKVAIHEAMRLAEKYGGAESARFVNGVLDAIYRELASLD